ncbi:caffeic acid 3-O-methyltransferase-like isoform X2 [Primulina eburnea]|uniref:caffeic acid 3-O-methyltransferase-like isoform X2 n=1 Tax=Primulina eburnea TaxID=1245227 RepID=UPI003C6BE269
MDDDQYSEEENVCLALQLACGSVLPMVLKAAIELDLLEIIRGVGPNASLSASEIASQLPTKDSDFASSMLDRILRLLAVHAVLKCSRKLLPCGGFELRYALAPVSNLLIKNEDGACLAPTSLFIQDKVMMESWYHLKDAILEATIPFNKAHGMTLFEYAATDSRFNNVLNLCMSNHSVMIVKKIVEIYKGFQVIKSLVDVGGGIGVTLDMIVSKYPSIKAINFDLPHVVQVAPSYPEYILSETPSSSSSNGDALGALTDVVMLAYTPSGKERTLLQYEALAREAGFTKLFKICSSHSIWIMELHK